MSQTRPNKKRSREEGESATRPPVPTASSSSSTNLAPAPTASSSSSTDLAPAPTASSSAALPPPPKRVRGLSSTLLGDRVRSAPLPTTTATAEGTASPNSEWQPSAFAYNRTRTDLLGLGDVPMPALSTLTQTFGVASSEKKEMTAREKCDRLMEQALRHAKRLPDEERKAWCARTAEQVNSTSSSGPDDLRVKDEEARVVCDNYLTRALNYAARHLSLEARKSWLKGASDQVDNALMPQQSSFKHLVEGNGREGLQTFVRNAFASLTVVSSATHVDRLVSGLSDEQLSTYAKSLHMMQQDLLGVAANHRPFSAANAGVATSANSGSSDLVARFGFPPFTNLDAAAGSSSSVTLSTTTTSSSSSAPSNAPASNVKNSSPALTSAKQPTTPRNSSSSSDSTPGVTSATKSSSSSTLASAASSGHSVRVFGNARSTNSGSSTTSAPSSVSRKAPH